MKVSLCCILTSFIWIAVSTAVYASAPSDYYQSVEDKHGNELKSILHRIIDNHKVIPYTRKGNSDWHDGNNMDVWEALVYTDSACPDEDPKCGYIQLLYLDEPRHMSKANRGKGKHDAWDREHVWPKSRGFKSKKQDGYTDLHHLRPADRNINSAHSNYGYDSGGDFIVDKRDSGDMITITARVDKTGKSFEPTDPAKGQVARMIFYMAVRYEIGDQEKPEYMPDLTLRDSNDRVKEPWIGDLCTLLLWNNTFLPTAFEKRRNDRVMEIQGNRNPFIDNPLWANSIWKEQC